jgi:excisionase family DNA binding protein
MSAPVSTTETLCAGQAKDGTVGLVQLGRKNRHIAAATPTSRTLITLQETTEYLRVTRSTIHRLLKRNRIPAFRIGRHSRFNAEEINSSSSVMSKEPKADV